MAKPVSLPRALLTWLLLLVAAFANGAFRSTYGAWFAEPTANRVSCGIGILLFAAVIWGVTQFWPFRSRRHAWRTGALWAALTIVFETSFGYFRGLSWTRIFSEYALWNGRWWTLVLASLLILPPLLHALDQYRGRHRPAIASALVWSVTLWVACASSIVIVRAAAGIDAALRVHVVVAPLAAFAVARAYCRHPRRLSALPTALLLVASILVIDALFVATFLERSFAMFTSPIGTWIPLALIFTASLIAARPVTTP